MLTHTTGRSGRALHSGVAVGNVVRTRTHSHGDKKRKEKKTPAASRLLSSRKKSLQRFLALSYGTRFIWERYVKDEASCDQH